MDRGDIDLLLGDLLFLLFDIEYSAIITWDPELRCKLTKAIRDAYVRLLYMYVHGCVAIRGTSLQFDRIPCETAPCYVPTA
jgi:hypothetical protein